MRIVPFQQRPLEHTQFDLHLTFQKMIYHQQLYSHLCWCGLFVCSRFFVFASILALGISTNVVPTCRRSRTKTKKRDTGQPWKNRTWWCLALTYFRVFGATNSRHEQTLWSTKPKGFSPNPKVNVFAVRQCCNKRFLTSKTPDSPGWHEALHWPIFFCQFSGQKWNAQLIAGNPNVAQKISQDGWVTFLESSGNQQSCGTWPLFYTVHRQLKESGNYCFPEVW